MYEVAIFGGTFDPIHIGHLRGLIEAREILNIKRIIVIPAGIPPHKPQGDQTPPQARLEMTRRAVASFEWAEVSDVEIKRGGVSYTIDTIEEIREREKVDRLGLIIGSDSLLELNTWHRFEEILENADIIVIPRPGFLERLDAGLVEAAIKPIGIEKMEKNSPVPGCVTLRTDAGKNLTLLPARRINVSATEIREKVSQGKSIKFLVPPEVERYIIEEKLYRR